MGLKCEVTIMLGDITKVSTDAIVNAANTSLLGGGGVDGAIHRTGGSQILEECRAIKSCQGGCKVGEAVITNTGKLKAKKVIHTVGPVWNGGNNNEELLLRNCYRNVLSLALQNEMKSIAFPSISTGIYKFPKNIAAQIAVDEINRFIVDNDCFNEIVFVCFDSENFAIYDLLVNGK